MLYPGHVVKAGEPDQQIVKTLKQRLNSVLVGMDNPGLRLDEADPDYGAQMQRVVKIFQARRTDTLGRPLLQDGRIGPLTWAALFGMAAVTASPPSDSSLLARVLNIAAGEEAKKVREKPRDSNRGPEVDLYLKRAGVGEGLSWCCAFVYWSFDEAARALQRKNPMARTAGCIDHWNRAVACGGTRIPARQALQNPAVIKEGMVFIMDHGKGLGHTGLVERVDGGLLTTIEGNTDGSGTREGGGVYRLRRKVGEINKGFIDYGHA